MPVPTYGPALPAGRISSSFVRDNLKLVFEFWAAHGVDRRGGGFWNGVTIDGHRPSPPDQKAEFAQVSTQPTC